MRKPLLALSLVVSTGLGAVPVANALAATPTHGTTTHSSVSTNQSTTRATGSNSIGTGATSPSYTTQNATAVVPSNSVSGASIVSTALKYLGYPYTATGNSPSTGFSCIGFVSFVYRSNGIPLPGDLQDALNYAPQVPFADLEPGDILYFQNTVWPGLSHAAIYIGGGRFVHAEYYGYGVRISSFNNDPRDYNYWIGKYLGANRPWGGAAIGTVIAPPTSSSTVAGQSVAPSTAVSKSLSNGPTALVAVPSLNVRASATKSSAVQTILQQGASVTILSHKNGWYKVQLPDGSIGWVISAGLGLGASSSSGASTSVQVGAVAPTVGNPVAPTRQGVTTPVRRNTVTSKVSGLRVHSGPSLGAPVVNAIQRGQHMVVVGKSSGWVKVRLSDGSVGWVSAAYVPAKARAASSTTVRKVTKVNTTVGGQTTAVATHLRTGPSLNRAIAATLVPGTTYSVIGSSSGWLHVQLANGRTGWISETVTARTSTSTTPTYKQVAYSHSKRTQSTVKSTVAKRPANMVTAGVRVHASPSAKGAVVTVAPAGTHVTVLGHSGGWTLVRLPSGQVGYVSGQYVS